MHIYQPFCWILVLVNFYIVLWASLFVIWAFCSPPLHRENLELSLLEQQQYLFCKTAGHQKGKSISKVATILTTSKQKKTKNRNLSLLRSNCSKNLCSLELSFPIPYCKKFGENLATHSLLLTWVETIHIGLYNNR